MSIKLMTKVFENQTLKGNEKLLALALADYSNDNGICYPSYNSLVIKTSMNKGSVSKWLKSLEDKGFILKAKRSRKNGSNASNKYLMFPSELFNNLDEEDKDFFIQSLEVKPPIEENQSLEVELGGGLEVELGGGLEVELAYEPSLITITEETPLREKKENAYDRFLNELKTRVPYKSKVTKTKDGEKLFKTLESPTKVADAYVKHQKEKGEFAIRITAFMLDIDAYLNQHKQQSTMSAVEAHKQRIKAQYGTQL